MGCTPAAAGAEEPAAAHLTAVRLSPSPPTPVSQAQLLALLSHHKWLYARQQFSIIFMLQSAHMAPAS